MSLSWEEFIARHAQAVLDSALRVVAHPADAEDVAQDVFLEILRGGRMKELADQPALVRTIATRRALDRLRKHKECTDLDGRERDQRQYEPSEFLIAAELDQRLRRELARLPSREAEVFCLTYFEQLSTTEIASLLGSSLGAVSKSLSVARKKLSIAFEKHRTDLQS
jgi:RNA polymerase sigma-70 factor, ECF subfamily